MKQWQGQPKSFRLYLYAMLAIVAILCASFFVLVFEQQRYQDAVENREESIRLASELRQSSNDLARLVRTYVITGDSLYKEQFRAVVEIRDGVRPRPENYSLAYWDIHGVDTNLEHIPDSGAGEKVSLIDLMRRVGITSEELSNLERSKKLSDALVVVENRAIELVEEDIPTSPQKRDQALSMLADDYFISMKAQIMESIVVTEQMIIQRTQKAVDKAKKRLLFVISSLFVSGGLLIFMIFKVGQQLSLIIGCSIEELQSTIHELGKGDFLTPIKVQAELGDSVIGWLSKMQKKLAQLNLEHFKAIIESSDDAIISKNIQGIIASWNNGAEKIFGYTAEEMIGQPMTTVIPVDRGHEEPEFLGRIASGKSVDHFVTQRLHKDGSLIDVSVTLSPIRDSDGKVIGASKIARDISATVAAEAEIKRLAFFDSLTGLANRRLLHDRLDQVYLRAKRDGISFAALYIDLDNFKQLNDAHGHEAGDRLLKNVALRLMDCIRQSDTASRFGGDEFLIILPGTKNRRYSSDNWPAAIVKKIHRELMKPYDLGFGFYQCTLSIGVYVYDGDAVDAEDIIRMADQAMYSAKRSGKSSYRFYEK